MKNSTDSGKPRIVDAKSVKLSDIPQLHFARPNKNTRTGKKKVFVSEICAFDIETTVIDEINQAVMYIWQFAIENTVFIGRTWNEFQQFIRLLKICANGYNILCYVHNLSYEFQFLTGIWEFSNEDVFCTESRKILYCVHDFIEFRCSYLLSNMSLAEMTRKYNVEHQKLSGEQFDYSVKRYSWTPITEEEKAYCVYDVLGVVESVHAIMDLYNDTVYTIPLTSTGFVRREVKKAMRTYTPLIKKIYPSYDVFRLLRAEFRGGNTHANRYFAGEIIDRCGNSYDIASSYPSAQCNRLYPMTPFEKIVFPSASLIDRLIDHNKACLFTARFYNIALRDKYWSVPYIPIAKCSYWRGVVNDNGRVLQADEIEITLTDVDWKIIVSQYTFEIEIDIGYKSAYGKLPQGIIDCNIEYFKGKTELKGIEGQELYYNKNKSLLNSIYGMTCQSPCKKEILFENHLYIDSEEYTEEELLHMARKRAFVAYQFACWTTSHARAALEQGIKICGENLLYVDTDSCKTIGTADFTQYNKEQERLSMESGLYAVDKFGVTHYGGVFEHDGEFTRFCTHGAKKYAYEDASGLHLTVSGVGKKRGAQSLLNSGGLVAFQEGYIFHNCGKTQSIYNDENYGIYEIDEHEIEITRNVVIEEKDYTLSRTDDYNEIIKQSKQFLYKMEKLLKSTDL